MFERRYWNSGDVEPCLLRYLTTISELLLSREENIKMRSGVLNGDFSVPLSSSA